MAHRYKKPQARSYSGRLKVLRVDYARQDLSKRRYRKLEQIKWKPKPPVVSAYQKALKPRTSSSTPHPRPLEWASITAASVIVPPSSQNPGPRRSLIAVCRVLPLITSRCVNRLRSPSAQPCRPTSPRLGSGPDKIPSPISQDLPRRPPSAPAKARQ